MWVLESVQSHLEIALGKETNTIPHHLPSLALIMVV